MTEQTHLEAIARLFQTWQAQELDATAAPEPFSDDGNVFTLFRIGADEISHSAFLAWLFDPGAAHRQGSRFLEAFLAVAQPEIALQLPARYRVQTELSRAASIVDIVVYEPGDFLLFIENKTTSPDTRGQVDREFGDLRQMGAVLGVPEERQFAVYLTPYGRRARGESAQQWRHVAYRKLGRAFADLAPEVDDGRTRYLLEDWLDTLPRFRGTWRESMTSLSPASALVGANWPTVLEIAAARERLNDELLALLFSVEPLLVEQDWWEQDWVFRQEKTWIYIYNRRWLNAEGYTLISIGVQYFNANHVFGPSAPPELYIWVRPAYAALQGELRELLRAEGHPVVENKRSVLYRGLMQCAASPEAVAAYPDQVRAQIVALFTEYADFILRHDDMVQRSLAAVQDIPK